MVAGCGGSGGSDPVAPPPEPPIQISYSINVTAEPDTASVRVGQTAEASITWHFTSTAANPSSSSYNVSSTTDGVQITGGTGTSLPNNDISTSLRYECASIETVVAQLTVSVDSTNRNVSWEINCTGQRITVESIESSVASIGFEAQASLIWRFESIGEEPTELEYTVTSNDESVTVTPSEGSATPEESITVEVRYMCQTAGDVTFELTASVGTASQVASWVVTCTEEAITVETPPAIAVVSIGDEAVSQFTWLFSSTGSEPRHIPYSASTDYDGVTITDAMGTALPESSVNHQLGFQCEVQGLVEIELTLTVGSDSRTISWIVECTIETIEILNYPMASHISIGESAAHELVWQFTTTSDNERTFSYSVVPDNPSVGVAGGAGVASPDNELSTQLIFACESAGTVQIDVVITVANTVATTTWLITCSEESVVVDQALSDLSISVGSEGVSSFSWRVETTGIQSRMFSYSIESRNEALEIHPNRGQIGAEDIVVSRVSYTCTEAVQVGISITINVGSASHPLLWHVECSEEQIEVASSPMETTVASTGSTTSIEFQWSISSTTTRARSFPFTVMSTTAGIQIVSPTGFISAEEELVTVVSYECREVGITEALIVISAGSATSELTWSIECSQETIEIVDAPTPISVSVGEFASSTIRWRAKTTSSFLEELDYLIKPDRSELTVELATGRIGIDEVIETNIVFECTAQAQLVFEIAIEVGNARHALTWIVECTTESIVFELDPLPVTAAEVGETAKVELNWLLNSTAHTTREFMYEITTNSSNVHISNPTGMTKPGVAISNDISYVCHELGEFDIVFSVTVGSTSAATSWSVACAREYIAVLTAPMQRQVPVGDSVTAELVWEYRSPSTSEEVRYEISSSTRGIQILNSRGTVLPGTEVTSRLRFPCSTRRNVTVMLRISAGDISRDLPWRIECAGEDLTQFITSFFQGPRIGVFRFESTADGWTSSAVTESEEDSHDRLQFRTNRQVFVEIRTEHNELVPLPIAVQMDVGTSGFVVNQIGEVETKVNESDVGYKYTSTFLFDIAAGIFTSPSKIQVLVDPESLYPELDESNNTASFTFDARNTWELPKLHVTFVPIRTQDGVPDLSDIEPFVQPLYELMPVGTIEVSIGEELDAGDVSWTLDTSRVILDSLHVRYMSSADSDSYYQGIVRRPEEVEVNLCGNAFLDSTVSITVEQCSHDTGAHELGHNFNLKHAPACGAENTNVDLDFPYPAGNIGRETGWLMQQKRFIDGSAPKEFVQLEYRYYDIMSYCPETFTSRYSYGKALAYLNRKYPVLASLPPYKPVGAEYAKVQDRSVVLSGLVSPESNWELRHIMLVDLNPKRFYASPTDHSIAVIHEASATVLHREPLHVLRAAHGNNEHLSWGVRLPYFDSDDVHVYVVDEVDRIMLEVDLDARLRALTH